MRSHAAVWGGGGSSFRELPRPRSGAPWPGTAPTRRRQPVLPAQEERLPGMTCLGWTHPLQACHRNIWQPPHCPLCPSAIRPVILLGRDMPVVPGVISPMVWMPLPYSAGRWHLEGCLTSWRGSSSWGTRINGGSPGGPGLGGLLAPLPHWSGGGVGLLEALTRPARAAWDCE